MPSSKKHLNDEVPLCSESDSGGTKAGISKKDKRAARHQKWIKSIACSLLLLYVLIE